jgi:predicted transcriptional regulator
MFAAVEARGNATVSELIEESEYGLAYSTIKTTLDRLYEKGWLNRQPEGYRKRFRYSLRYSKEEREREAVKVAIANLLHVGSSPKLCVSYLVDLICEYDIEFLTELERLLEEKRHGSRP